MPGAGQCRSAGGLDLGEVSLHGAGQADLAVPLSLGDEVEAVSFRKPSGMAALRTTCALAAATGAATACLRRVPGSGVRGLAR